MTAFLNTLNEMFLLRQNNFSVSIVCVLTTVRTAALVVPATRRSTLGDRPPGFSRHSRQAVELIARRHHRCNISVDF